LVRIVFLCEQYPPIVWDGVGIYTHDIAQALAGLGHEVHVVCTQGIRVSDEADGDVRVHRRPLLRVPVSRFLGRFGRLLAGPNYPRDSLSLRASLAVSYAFWLRRLDLRPDVIETQDGETRALSIALRHAAPLVIHLHTPTMLDLRMRDGRLRSRGRLADRLDRFSAHRADALTAPSGLLVDTLREYRWLPADRDVEIIPLPFDATPFADISPPHHTGRTVLTVGRLEWRKGLDVLLEATGRMVRAGVDVKVVFAGRSAGDIGGLPAVRWLDRRAGALGVPCRFDGHVPRSQLPSLYAEARVVVVPSRFESFSVAGLEGMAAGRPVVATSTTGVAPWIERSGGGTVVPPEDPGILADALTPYLADHTHAATVGARGRAGAAVLDSVTIARRRTEVYQRAVAGHRSRKEEA
jgi:glycogen synthase